MKPIVSLLREELAETEANANNAARQEAHWQSVRARETNKAERIRALLAVYEVEGGTGETEGTQAQTQPSADAAFDGTLVGEAETPETPDESGFGPATASVRTLSKGERVKQEAAEFLRVHGTQHRSEILRHLIALGVMGHEKSPLSSLAAYLSENRDIFVPDGQGNFSLRRDAETANGAA